MIEAILMVGLLTCDGTCSAPGPCDIDDGSRSLCWTLPADSRIDGTMVRVGVADVVDVPCADGVVFDPACIVWPLDPDCVIEKPAKFCPFSIPLLRHRDSPVGVPEDWSVQTYTNVEPGLRVYSDPVWITLVRGDWPVWTNF